MGKSVSNLYPMDHAFQFPEDKTEYRPGQAEHFSGGNTAFDDVHGS